MKALGFIICAGMAIAVLRAVTAALIIFFIGACVVAFVVRPREMLGLTVILALVSLAHDRPIVVIAMSGIFMTGALITNAFEIFEIP